MVEASSVMPPLVAEGRRFAPPPAGVGSADDRDVEVVVGRGVRVGAGADLERVGRVEAELLHGGEAAGGHRAGVARAVGRDPGAVADVAVELDGVLPRAELAARRHAIASHGRPVEPDDGPQAGGRRAVGALRAVRAARPGGTGRAGRAGVTAVALVALRADG